MENIKLDNELTDLIFSLGRRVKGGMAFSNGTKHLTLYQLHALGFIAKQKEIRMADFAQHFSITMPSATALINKLVEEGLLKRIENKEDRRVVQIKLSQKGEKVVKEIARHRNDKLSRILSFIPEDDKTELLRIVEKILEGLNENEKK
ncbi:MAG: MarR family transcriptional regulator [Patescibacteria group bacterium]|nr:MarR family transcriptional regulator [Patescibacteria group bacterium]